MGLPDLASHFRYWFVHSNPQYGQSCNAQSASLPAFHIRASTEGLALVGRGTVRTSDTSGIEKACPCRARDVWALWFREVAPPILPWLGPSARIQERLHLGNGTECRRLMFGGETDRINSLASGVRQCPMKLPFLIRPGKSGSSSAAV